MCMEMEGSLNMAGSCGFALQYNAKCVLLPRSIVNQLNNKGLTALHLAAGLPSDTYALQVTCVADLTFTCLIDCACQ